MVSRNKYKLFLDQNLELQIVPMNDVDDMQYYHFLKEMKNRGLTQFLFTSKLTINLLLQILQDNHIQVVNIKLYDEDEQTSKKIKKLFENYQNGDIDSEEVHSILEYLEDDYSIDIRSIKVQNLKDNHGSLELFVNGIFLNRDEYWNNFLKNAVDIAWENG